MFENDVGPSRWQWSFIVMWKKNRSFGWADHVPAEDGPARQQRGWKFERGFMTCVTWTVWIFIYLLRLVWIGNLFKMMSKKQWSAMLCLHVSYLFLGASIFYHIENPLEVEKLALARRERNELRGEFIKVDFYMK